MSVMLISPKLEHSFVTSTSDFCRRSKALENIQSSLNLVSHTVGNTGAPGFYFNANTCLLNLARSPGRI